MTLLFSSPPNSYLILQRPFLRITRYSSSIERPNRAALIRSFALSASSKFWISVGKQCKTIALKICQGSDRLLTTIQIKIWTVLIA
ncbi:MAG: hypothetical protein NW214_01980 [Pseudanabaenaceae cyanobacterium bins.39]|nr:hypothetical protein [Pseudanabaenaceae cyanobacterium bins.39]